MISVGVRTWSTDLPTVELFRRAALTARWAHGWEASYVTPTGFAALSQRLDGLRATAGRAAGDLRGSVEADVLLGTSPGEGQAWTRRFCAERGVSSGHTVLGTALAGDAGGVAARALEYAAAGATDLMLGFADYAATGMLERFARDVLPRLTAPAVTR